MSRSVFNSLCETWHGMSVVGRIVAIGAVCVSVLYGGGKGERRGNREEGIENNAERSGKGVLSGIYSDEIATDINMSSTRAKNWSVRGAWDDVFTLKI